MGITCSGCGYDRTTSREVGDASRETQRAASGTDEHTVHVFPTSSSTNFAKTSWECKDKGFLDEDVVPTRAPSSHRSDTALKDPLPASPDVLPNGSTASAGNELETESISFSREHPKCDSQNSFSESRDREIAEKSVSFDPDCQGGRISTASPPPKSDDASSRRSPESHVLQSSPSTENFSGDEKKKKKKNRWRPSFKRLSKRSTSFLGLEDKKKEKKEKNSMLQRQDSSKKAPADRVRIKTNNANVPLDYRWLEATLMKVACNQANTLGSADAQTGKAFTPLFFVIGGCPNYFCGMQAIAYFSSPDGEVDFWWVKPQKTSGTEIEHATLSRQAKGPHKNDPGRSKPFYKPLADMFQQGHLANDGRRFLIEALPGQTVPRAIIEEDGSSSEMRRRLYIHLVWQEDWTSNPFAKSKYIKGKLVYQRNPEDLQFYAREYCIKDGVFTFSVFEDGPHDAILPDDTIKELYEPS